MYFILFIDTPYKTTEQEYLISQCRYIYVLHVYDHDNDSCPLFGKLIISYLRTINKTTDNIYKYLSP